MVKKNIKNLRQLELDFDDKPQLIKDSKFNDKNIFTNQYEKPFIYKNKQMTEEDRNKFIELNENVKLKIVETLLDNEENSKIMESNMENILKELNSFKEQFEKMKNDKIEENKRKTEEDKILDEIINRDKERENALDSTEIDESLFIESYEITTKLKDILLEKKMSQTELCEKTSINKSTLSFIISNPEKITLKNAYKIAKILKKPIEEIFKFDLNMDDYIIE